MKNIYILSLLLIISACGGGGGGGGTDTTGGGNTGGGSTGGGSTGGGSSGGGSTGGGTTTPFDLQIGLTSFSTNEDTAYSGALAATANEDVTLTYAITSEVTNGTLNLGSSGAITYTPNQNYNGSDTFSYSVTAASKNETKNATVAITVNSINDLPVMSFLGGSSGYSKTDLIIEDNPSIAITISDIDHEIDNLTFDALLGTEVIPATFTMDAAPNPENSGSLVLDLSNLDNGGLYNAELRVNDGTDTVSITFEAWFAANKEIITIQQDVDASDGFGSDGDKISKNYNVYYLSGSSNSKGKTKYLFIGDSLDSQLDISLYRRALLASLNKLNDSDAKGFFNNNYFTVVSAEPVEPDGTSPVGIRTGCYDFDPEVYCIDDMDDDIFDILLSNNVLVSTLTRVQGRGVNLGRKNIQRITENNPEDTSNTLMHELGHAHGEMGDEYRTDDDRDVSQFAEFNVNTTTQSDPTLVKWHHHIEDKINVLGQSVNVCYNTGDGRIYDRDAGEYVEDAVCDCLANEWGPSEIDANGDPSYPFIRKNPECGKVGLFEGNYYGDFGHYRPTFCSIMDSCDEGGYGKVNIEGFAIGSIHNQGLYDAFDPQGNAKISFNKDSSGEFNVSITISAADAEYDTSKITLKWYVDGIEDPSKENQKTVTFDRSPNDSVVIYTMKALDLTGTIVASDDVLDNTDFYEGLFQSYFVWVDGSDYDYDPSPSTYTNYNYGYMDGPLGFTWGINWASW